MLCGHAVACSQILPLNYLNKSNSLSHSKKVYLLLKAKDGGSHCRSASNLNTLFTVARPAGDWQEVHIPGYLQGPL